MERSLIKGENSLEIAVASGKGGTGKTTVAASLARLWPGRRTAVDLDVEAPNLHLFLNPPELGRETVFISVPEVDESKCTHCRACAEICQFKAINVLGNVLYTAPEMCHGCGGCIAVCPEKAIRSGKRELGEVILGGGADLRFAGGRLRVGEAMSPPLMREVKKRLDAMAPGTVGDVIIDAPPGVSCPAVNAVMDADVVILVTEPTPFGFHDLKLAAAAFAPLGPRLGVVVNRAGIGNRQVYDFCRAEGFPVLAEIPFDRNIAEAYSRGRVIGETTPELGRLFEDLIAGIKTLAGKGQGEEEATVG